MASTANSTTPLLQVQGLKAGYGKAEALLEEKWPERYNALGHLEWTGRLYGRGFAADEHETRQVARRRLAVDELVVEIGERVVGIDGGLGAQHPSSLAARTLRDGQRSS